MTVLPRAVLGLCLLSLLTPAAMAQVKARPGDNLAVLVRQVHEGGTLELAAGEYRLLASLHLNQSISLMGAGRDRTRIVSSAPGSLMRFEGAGQLVVKGISFDHQGQLPAEVLVIEGGIFDIQDARFSGGVFDGEGSLGGDGLWVRGGARGTIVGSEFSDNALYGLEVTDQAQVLLENNRFGNNGHAGLAVFDEGGGRALRNVLEQNRHYGAIFADNSFMVLQESVVQGNRVGLYYRGAAGGVARRNTVQNNYSSGIEVDEQAIPRLESNSVRGNQVSGIAYEGMAGGVALGNLIEENRNHGVQVALQATPVVQNNLLRRNRGAGLLISGHSSLVVRGNTVEDNGTSGIVVAGRAEPTLEDNTIRANRASGIAFQQNAAGVARRNLIEGNREHGIKVLDQASPRLEDNIIRGNALEPIFNGPRTPGAPHGWRDSGRMARGLGLSLPGQPLQSFGQRQVPALVAQLQVVGDWQIRRDRPGIYAAIGLERQAAADLQARTVHELNEEGRGVGHPRSLLSDHHPALAELDVGGEVLRSRSRPRVHQHRQGAAPVGGVGDAVEDVFLFVPSGSAVHLPLAVTLLEDALP